MSTKTVVFRVEFDDIELSQVLDLKDGFTEEELQELQKKLNEEELPDSLWEQIQDWVFEQAEEVIKRRNKGGNEDE